MNFKIGPKNVLKNGEKIEHNLDPKIITEKNHNSNVIQIIGTGAGEPNAARKCGGLTPKFGRRQKIMKNKAEKKNLE